MNRTFVRLLLWFFIAALPVQGWAAAVRTCCGPLQGGGVPAQSFGAGMAAALPSAAAQHGRHVAMSMPAAGNGAGRALGQHCADMAQPLPPVEPGGDAAAVAAIVADPAAAAVIDSVADAAADSCQPHQSHSAHDAGSCSACAACCLAALSTMPSTLQVTPISFNSVKIVLAPVALLSGYIPGGLERPPRHSFA